MKIKFRASMIENKLGVIYYQVIHNRVVRQHKTDYRIYPCEWDDRLSKITLLKSDVNRKLYLQEINDKIQNDIKVFYEIVAHLNSAKYNYTADDIIDLFQSDAPNNYLFVFMELLIQ